MVPTKLEVWWFSNHFPKEIFRWNWVPCQKNSNFKKVLWYFDWLANYDLFKRYFQLQSANIVIYEKKNVSKYLAQATGYQMTRVNFIFHIIYQISWLKSILIASSQLSIHCICTRVMFEFAVANWVILRIQCIGTCRRAFMKAYLLLWTNV